MEEIQNVTAIGVKTKLKRIETRNNRIETRIEKKKFQIKTGNKNPNKKGK